MKNNKQLFNFVPTNIVFNADNKNIYENVFVVLDIETTGLDANNDKIIQFGAMKYKGNQLIESIEFLINPEIEIPEFITNINHITNDDVKGQIKIKEGLNKILDFIKDDSFLIAHNGINFDLNFINTKLKENKMDLIKNPLLDTMWLSKAINPHFIKHSLLNIVKEYQIPFDNQLLHQALYDVKMLSNIWFIMVEELKKYNLKTLKQINKKFVKIQKTNIDLSKVHC